MRLSSTAAYPARQNAAKIEHDFQAFRQQCLAFNLPPHEKPEQLQETPEIFSLMLETVRIDAPYFDQSGGELTALFKSRLKTLLRWMLRPLVKIVMVHQQER